jgi:hypothetical protein
MKTVIALIVLLICSPGLPRQCLTLPGADRRRGILQSRRTSVFGA